MLLLIAGLILFLAFHLIPTFPAARTALVRRYGETRYKIAFAVLAAAGLALIVIGFGQARAQAVPVWTPPAGLRHIALLLLLPVFPLFAAASSLPSHLKSWTRHPMITGVILWAAAHLLANGHAHEIILFGSFLVWALFNRTVHARMDAGTPRPALPPKAWRNDLIALAIGGVLYAVFVLWGHTWLIGVPVV